jgi:eukaryotic-like serine/threonine-protein kinase
MSLAAGSRLGPYEITAPIGAGGMGEVYKARDTRLDRSVAIKVLPPEFSADPDRRARFEREAKTIAGLNHPHICTLHDIGQADGTTYLVMELLAGETLAGRLEKGPLPLEQALGVATEIADALATAHRQGVVHRDLKPGNVMLTRSGAKLLDFGLAKLTGHGEQPAAASLASAPTETRPLTSEGAVVGTLQYMAPEQVEGKPADARTDLWALGAILYEMLTGRRAFAGTSAAALIGNIMNSQPPVLAMLQPLTPRAVDRLVRHCLAKNPDDRPDTAHDIADDLRWMREAGSTSVVAATTSAPRRWQNAALLVAGAAAAAFALLAGGLWLTRSVSAPRSPVYLLLTAQRPAAPAADPQRTLAISRDGRQVVYAADIGGVLRLCVRRMESPESAVIPGTDGAMSPFFSPDGKRIGFFADGMLKTVAVSGGVPTALAATTGSRGATWTRDDTIIFAPETDAGLWQIPASGGTATLVAKPDAARHERSYRFPEILPDDDTILFTLAMSDIRSFDEARLMARSRKTGEQRELLRGGSFPMYADTGHLLFARAGAILAVPFDPGRRLVTGVPAPVVPGVVTHLNGSAQYAVAQTGTLVFVPGADVSRTALLKRIDRTGRTEPLGLPPGPYAGVRISPDGRLAALEVDGANTDICLLDLERLAVTRLTLEWNNTGVEWSPDGSRVVFSSMRAASRKLYSQAVDGRTDAEPLMSDASKPATANTKSTWSPDGRFLAFDRLDRETGWDIWALALDAGHEQHPFLVTPFNERSPRFSPDGHWLAYESDETGRSEVYVQPFPGPGRKTRISTDGGGLPVWARDGRELFYRGADGASVFGVTIVSSPGLSPGQPTLLFRQTVSYRFDVAPDGRFLIIENLPDKLLSPITVVQNWFAELKAKVPTGR